MSSVQNKKKEFNETLAELVEFATVSGNLITKDQISLYFKDIIEDDQYEPIYNYLLELKIKIDGIHNENIKVDNTSETEHSKNFYKMYLEDLNNLSFIDIDKEEMLRNVVQSDVAAINKITEVYLPLVIKIVEENLSGSLSRSELVAEGNAALFEANLAYRGNIIVDEYEKFIIDEIYKKIRSAIDNEIGNARITDHLVERINSLNNASTELAGDLGREPSLEELSKHLSLSEDEVKELMKITIDALTVDEGQTLGK